LATHKSALKRVRQNEKRRLRNQMNKTRVKNIVKKTRQSAGESPEQTQASLKEAMRVINKAANKGAIHPKTASRKIARLSRFLNSQTGGSV